MEIKTVTLKGKEYAPVHERIKAFHDKYKQGSITTSYEFKEGYVIFKATVTPLVDKNEEWTQERYFTGHAFGKVGTEKAFEKIESVAIGRALAIAGFGADGSIASFEEIQQWQAKDSSS